MLIPVRENDAADAAVSATPQFDDAVIPVYCRLVAFMHALGEHAQCVAPLRTERAQCCSKDLRRARVVSASHSLRYMQTLE